MLSYVPYLVWLVTGLYCLATLGYAASGQWDNVLIFGGYSLANCGVLGLMKALGH